jgi:hypothetical protein
MPEEEITKKIQLKYDQSFLEYLYTGIQKMNVFYLFVILFCGHDQALEPAQASLLRLKTNTFMPLAHTLVMR